eukprot:TRINITY_DN2170_c0_g1_i1.p1 TRINITY_DN2170_c0_g1~~TRINITY_DN2170_c0_g1_i1.p1  ORF type:complete len:248 (+),score=23.17 TRINITY_DN2170_c0_g1_i1:40-783(+)
MKGRTSAASAFARTFFDLSCDLSVAPHTHVALPLNSFPVSTRSRSNRTFTFETSVGNLSQLSRPALPEIAFAGRSNVGKSSLLNALIGANLARVSKTPGRTQLLNFFTNQSIKVVDLPGYGYAKAPKDVALRWNQLTADFLRERPKSSKAGLSSLVLLIDGRHGFQPLDYDFVRFIDSLKPPLPYRIVLTKADLVVDHAEMIHKMKAVQASIRESCHNSLPIFHIVSAQKKIGLESLRADLGLPRKQ